MAATNVDTPPADGGQAGRRDSMGRQAVGAECSTLADVERAFAAALADHGLAPADGETIPADGNLHRYRIDGDRPGRSNGWAVLHVDGVPAGAAGSWRTGEHVTWCARRDRDLTPDERRAMREHIEAARAERARQRKREAQLAAERARRLYAEASPASPAHPYLRRKGIEPPPRVRQQDDRLVVPLYRVPICELVGVQLIDADGGKRFLRGTAKRGAAFPIPPADGDRSGPLVVAEGVATAVTVAAATGWQTVAALDAGNLEPVARALRAKYQDRQIIIAADRDGDDGGVGVTKAREAAAVVDGRIAVPPEPGDFNDLALSRGLEAARTGVGGRR